MTTTLGEDIRAVNSALEVEAAMNLGNANVEFAQILERLANLDPKAAECPELQQYMDLLKEVREEECDEVGHTEEDGSP
jgi:hypothetical protein